MKPSLFITGAGGFVGRALLDKLDFSTYQSVYCLTRKLENLQLPDNARSLAHVKVIEADLLDVSRYEAQLKECDTVIHMAALTGKAEPNSYFKVNAYGTMLLLDRCKQAGVKQFLFVSSIAVSYKDKYRYFYALSKKEAEKYVKNSGIPFAILRPTMIMGKGSAVLDGLAKLCSLPRVPVFGHGDVESQPIDVQDVVRGIIRIMSEPRFKGEVFELGGPEVLTIEEFMLKIAEARGKKEPKAMHLPLSLIVFFLALLERVVYNLLPLTVGQLASFRNNGSTDTNWLMKKLSPMMVGVDEQISSSLEKDPVPASSPLAKECRVFSRYLTGMEPNNYILEKYEACHQHVDFTARDFHDKLLLTLAGKGFFLTRMSDAYSRFFRADSLVRKKLAYLVAILEVSPPYFRYYDTADKSGLIGFIIKGGIKGGFLALHLIFSFIFLFPLQVTAKLTRPTPKGEQ